MREALPLLGVSLFFLLAIGGVIAVVVAMNGNQRKLQAASWQAFAERYGGQFRPGSGAFGGNEIRFPLPHTHVVVRTVMVSAMEAVGSPIFSDGGTYTLVSGPYPRRNGPTLKVPGPMARTLPGAVGQAGAYLPPGALLASSAAEATVVFPGAVVSEHPLWAGLSVVAALTSSHSA
ncbi:MAG: hypothetical protein JNM74_07890 [Myxococcales bacterium]|jgi:hypothetical protein|nr:hypothetical protein [Myxococcales bacterium]